MAAHRQFPLLDAAVMQTTDAVVITTATLDPPGPEIVYVNPAFCALTGYAPAELLGRTPRLLQGPATDRAELDRVRAAMEQGHPYHGEAINYHKDGHPYVLRWQLAPIRDAAGGITHWVATQRDVTAERAAETERAALLATTQQALQLRDTFLNTAAHELRTPLTALLGYSHLLERATTAPYAPEQAAHAAALVRRQAERLSALIMELLEVERMEAGALPLATEVVDLTALTAEVTGAFGTRVPLTHTLHVALPSSALWVTGDRVRLGDGLEELLTNALVFSPQGGRITVTLVQHGAVAELAVGDPGIGIPQAALPHVWERFYRAPNVDGHRMPGFGIGLFALRELVRLHGGSVAIESQEHVGSTVRVQLPLRTAIGAKIESGQLP